MAKKKRQTAALDPARQMELCHGYRNLQGARTSDATKDQDLAAFLNIFHPERGITSIEDAAKLRKR